MLRKCKERLLCSLDCCATPKEATPAFGAQVVKTEKYQDRTPPPGMQDLCEIIIDSVSTCYISISLVHSYRFISVELTDLILDDPTCLSASSFDTGTIAASWRARCPRYRRPMLRRHTATTSLTFPPPDPTTGRLIYAARTCPEWKQLTTMNCDRPTTCSA